MIRTTVLCGLLLTSLDVSAQIPARVGWDDLISKSTVIVVGVVEGSFSVMRKPRTPPASERLPDRNVITELPNIREMRVGSVIAVRVVEVVKKDGRVKRGRIVRLFIPSYPSEGMPVLLTKERCLIFLASLNPNDEVFTGAIVSRPNQGAGAQAPFNPASHYAVVMGDNGAVRLIPRNLSAIEEVKAAVAKRQ